ARTLGEAGTVDPNWLDWIPAEGVLAGAAFAVNAGPKGWDAAFAALDGAIRADPAQNKAAQLRTRLNLMALSAGIQPEIDLWPRLCGVTAWVSAGPAGAIDRALVALHA